MVYNYLPFCLIFISMISSNPNLKYLHAKLQNHFNDVISFFYTRKRKIIVIKYKSFSLLRKTKFPPRITINNFLIPCINSVKYLGITLDKHMTRGVHIDNLVLKCHKIKFSLHHIGNTRYVNKKNKYITLQNNPSLQFFNPSLQFFCLFLVL